MAHVELDLDSRGHGTVKVDGREIEMLSRVTFNARAGDVPELELEVLAPEIHTDVHAALVHIERTVPAADTLTRDIVALGRKHPEFAQILRDALELLEPEGE